MNTKQWVIATVVTTLVAFAHTAAAECEADEAQLDNTGYPMQASNDDHADRGKREGRDGDGNQGNHKQGSKDKVHPGKVRSDDGRAWYNPWGWRFSSQENDDNRDNQNSNRQSDPDSTRGQARAEERRRDKDPSRDDRPWYDPWGWFE